MTTAIRSSGCAPRSRPTRWPVSTPWRRTPSAARCWAPASTCVCTPMTRPTGGFSPNQIIRMIRRAGGRALIGLVGVQSNQFPRAVDLAQALSRRRAAGLHRRFPYLRLHRHAAGTAGRYQSRAGNWAFRSSPARPRSTGSMKCCATPITATLKPLYNYMDDLPALAGEPPPFLPRKHVRRTVGNLSSIDLGRGCPYQCSFCTIINVQGRKSRIRSADDLERSCGRITRKASSGSSSPTTISRATRIGSRCSTA